jgi:hypothetical protein
MSSRDPILGDWGFLRGSMSGWPGTIESVNAADVAQIVSAVATSAAAIFAAGSARVSRTAVERGNLAFVWPEFSTHAQDVNHASRWLKVRLHSDGPGIALDVRWSVFFVPEPGRVAWRRELRSRRPPPPESSPAQALPADEQTIGDELEDEPWWIVVRWSDSAGRRWEFNEATAGRELARKPRKIRRPTW